MKPLYTRLQEAKRQLGTPWEVLERDYLLSWILAGIGQVNSLSSTLAFKGGTSLKKCYFGEYRFSEDLDFSTLEGVPTGDAMGHAIRESCQAATEMLDEYAPVEIVCERYTERDPHPGGQEAFTIRARFPWHRQLHTRVKIEITLDEKVLKPALKRRVIHEYGEPLEAKIRTYALEEIVAEKLRAILQHIEKLHTQGWSRSRARDYYDLWRIMGVYREQLDLSNFVLFLREKCAARGRQLRQSRGLLPGTDGLVRQEDVESVARQAGSWVTVLRDRDGRATPTDRGSHHADEVTIWPVTPIRLADHERLWLEVVAHSRPITSYTCSCEATRIIRTACCSGINW